MTQQNVLQKKFCRLVLFEIISSSYFHLRLLRLEEELLRLEEEDDELLRVEEELLRVERLLLFTSVLLLLLFELRLLLFTPLLLVLRLSDEVVALRELLRLVSTSDFTFSFVVVVALVRLLLLLLSLRTGVTYMSSLFLLLLDTRLLDESERRTLSFLSSGRLSLFGLILIEPKSSLRLLR